MNLILPLAFTPYTSQVVSLNCGKTVNGFLLSTAALQHLQHLFTLASLSTLTHWLLTLSLPLFSTYISQPPACRLNIHPGCTNSSNLPTWTPTSLRLSLPLLIFLKLIDFIMPISHWPVHPPALTWCLQSASPQLWEIFQKIWHKCHMWWLISQKVPLRSLLLCCTHAHSSSPSTYSTSLFHFILFSLCMFMAP